MSNFLFPEMADMPAHCRSTREPAPVPQPKTGAKTGEERKREGMQAAENAKQPMVAVAREIAVDVCRGTLPHADGRNRADGLCTMDDVQHNWPADNDPLRNAAGAVFTDGNWEWTGEFVKSQRPVAHSNLLRVWRRKHGT